jgi:Nucleoside 2-deoxyribosyltransferase/pfkB family carbohydrate kinase
MKRNDVTAVGGVYREHCLHPHWQQVFGSGGRAASALACMGASVTLHSYADSECREVLLDRAAIEGFKTCLEPVTRSVSFSYVHGLDTPVIHGQPVVKHPSIHASADHVVSFGFIEGDAIVNAKRVVFDPQNAAQPERFDANGSEAQELVYVLNQHELRTLLQGDLRQTADALAESLLSQSSAFGIIVKLGTDGALVMTRQFRERVPAYRTERVFKIGSGDVFVSQLAYQWMLCGKSLVDAADWASKATAYYVNTQGFADTEKLQEIPFTPILPSLTRTIRKRVYLAGPFFTIAQLWLVDETRNRLREMGLDVFSPYHDVGRGSADDVVAKDLAAIDQCDLMLALTDDLDSGTLFEIGYARAKGKPVVVYCENESEGDLKMMQGSGCDLCEDYVGAVYRTVWTAASL